ncbi:MAG: NotI family restriction endonuclease [Chloroflexota bacterium]
MVAHGRKSIPVIICPHRMLENRKVFTDCIHLLTFHEPGNELHLVTEVSIPGGNIDYFLVSARNRQVVDFVGVELQTLDTTGTLWPQRQNFLRSLGFETDVFMKQFGINWKMNAKTILIQIHHKIPTFQKINRRLVLVIQNHLLEYMRRAFRFEHLRNASIGDPLHIHTYQIAKTDDKYTLNLTSRYSTDAQGVAASLGLKTEANIELEQLNKLLEQKISDATLFVPI